MARRLLATVHHHYHDGGDSSRKAVRAKLYVTDDYTGKFLKPFRTSPGYSMEGCCARLQPPEPEPYGVYVLSL